MHSNRKGASKEDKMIRRNSRAVSGYNQKVHNTESSSNANLREKSEDSRSQDCPESKILNSKIDCDSFINICDAFEKLLIEFNLVENDTVYDKLLKINKLIEKKISSIDTGMSECDSLSASSLLSLIPERLHSDVDSDLKKFMTEIICPLCSEIQSDKSTLVWHIDTECKLNLVRKSSGRMPLSEFQILPNNTFKCSVCKVVLKMHSFYKHKQNAEHVRALNGANKNKYNSECVFCSSCKVMVHNSYIQLEFHMIHEEHRRRRDLNNSRFFQDQGISCVFNEKNKFKCLYCSYSGLTPRSALEHLGVQHGTKQRRNNSVFFIFCIPCKLKIDMFEVLSHFNESTIHKASEVEETFELCIYCGFVCDSLMDLFFHMKKKCKEMNEIRQKLKTNNNITTNNEANSEIEEYRFKQKLCITVKDGANEEELPDYFRGFGEIMELSKNQGDLVIYFREMSAVKDILLLKNIIKIGDKKLKIIPGDQSKCNRTSIASQQHPEVEQNMSEDSNSVDPNREIVSKSYLDELFRRVSLHLKNSSKKSDSNDEMKIIGDCCSTLKMKSCKLVGFSGCELSFPFESVNIFCSPHEIVFSDSDNLMRKSYQKLDSSILWTDVELVQNNGPFRHIKCLHKETQRTCTITFMKSTEFWTLMLGDCINKNDLVHHFCLIIRFWLSVHDLKIVEYEYALIALLVFFLINEKILDLSAIFKDKEFLTDEFNDFKIKSDCKKSKITTTSELFQRFLHFVSKFDFKKEAICLPTSQSISKVVFMSNKFRRLTAINSPAGFIFSSMCIVDPILFANLAADIKEKDLKEFLEVVSSTLHQCKAVTD